MQEQFIQAVKKYAREHYTQDGWDIVVEAYEDDEIGEAIMGAKSEAEAIKKMAWRVGLQDERRREIEAEIF